MDIDGVVFKGRKALFHGMNHGISVLDMISSFPFISIGLGVSL
jgi:hypothetical protein